MKTRRIQAADIQSALREVRRTLGADAVIMTTRETSAGIEIIAGVLPGSAPQPASTPRKAPAPRAVTGGMSSLVAGLARTGRRERGAQAPATGVSAASELAALGFAGELTRKVMDDIRTTPADEQWDAALCALRSHIPVQGNSLLKHGGRVAVVGGTGVGKTTTVVKLAAHFARMHGRKSVALVNTDNLRVGASEQLRRYARLMGLAVCNVRGPSDVGLALERLRDRKLVLVDTAGASYHDLRLMEELQALRSAGTDVRCHLAVSCNTQLPVLERTVRALKGLALQGCILTKSDEAVSLGPALTFATRHALPVSFVTTGTNVPADIRVARPDWLVNKARKLLAESRRADAESDGVDALREVN